MDSDRVTFGASLPYASWETLAELVPRIERAGFDAAWVGDHLVGSHRPPAIEAWTSLGALAATTKRLRLGTNVTDPHRRNPAVLAQTVMTLDHISGGRAILGIGAGEAMNLQPYGIPWDHPVSRMEECILLLKRLWEGEPVDHAGRFYRMNGAVVAPKPRQQPHPPVWIAANGPRSLELTGRLADGWMPIRLPPKMYAEDAAVIRSAAEKAGRDPSEVTLGVFLPFFLGDTPETRARAARIGSIHGIQHSQRLVRQGLKVDPRFDNARYTFSPENVAAMERAAKAVPEDVALGSVLWGSPEACAKRLEDYVDAGARHLCINVGGGGNIDDAQALIDVVRNDFMPRFR